MTGTLPAMARALLAVVLVGSMAGCTGSDGGATTTSTTVAPTTTSTTQVPTPAVATEEFADCMRSEGIELPAIPLDVRGLPDLSAIAAAVDTSAPGGRAALAICAPILTASGAIDLSSDPEVHGLVLDQLYRFSECMREQGLEEFPDPIAEFSGVGAPYPPELVPFNDPVFGAALVACQERIGSQIIDN